MVKYNKIIFGVLTILHSVFGGLHHGSDPYSTLAAPSALNYNYARIASYSSPLIANPVATSYSSRYTAYTAVPLTASYAAAAPVSRFNVAGLSRAFSEPSVHQGHSAFYNPLVRQGVSAYAAFPIAGYRASFGGPSLRHYGASLRNFNAPLNGHGFYAAPEFDGFAEPVLTEQRTYGSFDSVGVDAPAGW